MAGDVADGATGYARFVAANARFLGFGFALIFVSSFGQTYYIGLFGADIRTAFDLSHGGFGAVYTIATLASAVAIFWTGALIDRFDLRVYVVGICVALVAAQAVMSSAASIIGLGVALFLLRQAGQGLMVHTSQTAMARYFNRGRGRALSISSLGFPAGEALFPIVGVSLVAWVGWRHSWLLTAAVSAVVLVPLCLWLLKGQTQRHRSHLASLSASGPAGSASDRSRADVVRDANFYLISAPFLLITFLITGLFFHQGVVVAERGWDLALVAKAFIGYAVLKAGTTLLAGQLIDRYGSMRLVSIFLTPLALALLVLAFWDAPIAAYVYLALAGLSTGGAQTLLGAVWAEIYGVRHIGSIRALVTSGWVAASALSTWAMGYLFDIGASVTQTALVSVGLIALASASAAIGVARVRRGRAAFV